MIIERVKADVAAKMLGVSPRHVKDLAAAGELPGVKIGSVWTFNPDKLTKWIEEREAKCQKTLNISTKEAKSGGSRLKLRAIRSERALKLTTQLLLGSSATNA